LIICFSVLSAAVRRKSFYGPKAPMSNWESVAPNPLAEFAFSCYWLFLDLGCSPEGASPTLIYNIPLGFVSLDTKSPLG
jgi:hypothetical protein